MTKEHVCRYLELQPDGSYFCGGCNRGYRIAVQQGEHNVAPIAKVTIRDGQAVRTGLYAPGLPDGEHDLFPVPLATPGQLVPFLEQQSVCPTAWYRGVRLAGPPDDPTEYDVDMSYGDDQPEGEGWIPLYRHAPQKPPHEREPPHCSTCECLP